MRVLAVLALAAPLAAHAQGFTGFQQPIPGQPGIPQTMIPQTAVPGAGAPPVLHPHTAGGVIVAPVVGAQGGGVVILNPGHAPGYVVGSELSGGGTALIGSGVGAGVSPTLIVPNAGGTAIVGGQGTTLIRQNPAGGTTIIGPNQPSTFVNPIPGGGATIVGPGGAPGYVIPTPQGAYVQPSGSAPPTYIFRP